MILDGLLKLGRNEAVTSTDASLDKIASARNQPAPTKSGSTDSWRVSGTYSIGPSPKAMCRTPHSSGTASRSCGSSAGRGAAHASVNRCHSARASSATKSVSRSRRFVSPGNGRVRRRGSLACTSTTCGGSSPVGCSSHPRTCTTCGTSWATRTSRRRAPYLRSTPVRLARALDRLDPEPPNPQATMTEDSPVPFAHKGPKTKTAGKDYRP